MRWLGHVARIRQRRDTYMVLVGKPEVNRPLGRHRCLWEDNSKMDLIWGYGGIDWIEMTQDRGRWRALLGAVMNPRVP
jgi:hypothetical protein